MKTFDIDAAVKDFGAIIHEVEIEQREVWIVRKRRTIARIVPEPEGATAVEIFADMGNSLDKKTADQIAKNLAKSRKQKSGRLSELRNPWAS